MARFLANYLFPDIGSSKQKRSLINEEKNSLPESVRGEGKLTTFLRRRGLVRRTRDAETADERENIEPFWDLIQQHDPLKEVKKGAPPSHPSMGNLKRKWKIPGIFVSRYSIIAVVVVLFAFLAVIFDQGYVVARNFSKLFT